MMSTLHKLESAGEPIRVVITGLGAMGKGLLYQTETTPGFRCVGVAEIDMDKAERCMEDLRLPYRVVETIDAAHDAVRNNVIPVCEDGELIARLEGAHAFIESTSAITAAAKFALTALEHGMHLVLMNAEIDLIFGPSLMQRAHELGLVYVSCDGDQHGVIKRLIDDMSLWGFEPVMGGNIKGFLDRYSNPTKIIPEADKRDLDYKMCTAYTDGTKLNIEMALLANALGMRTDRPGMHGPRAARVKDVFDLFDFDALWASRQPVVDYVLGAQPDGGVFAIGHCDHPYQCSMLRYYKMGNGPYYLFYRPYHLCHVEAMQCVAEAVLDSSSLLEPIAGFRTNVFAYAKKDLREGERLDGIGGYTCYGLIDNCPPDAPPEGLPICLAEDVMLKRDIAQDEPIRMSDIEYDPNRFDFDLYDRALQASSTYASAAQ
jgi:predicted homoserine dehydrogenase-like protein